MNTFGKFDKPPSKAQFVRLVPETAREFLATATATAVVGGVVGWVDLKEAAVGDTISELTAG